MVIKRHKHHSQPAMVKTEPQRLTADQLRCYQLATKTFKRHLNQNAEFYQNAMKIQVWLLVNAIHQVKVLLLKPTTSITTNIIIERLTTNQHHLRVILESQSKDCQHALVLRVKLLVLIAERLNNLKDARVMFCQQWEKAKSQIAEYFHFAHRLELEIALMVHQPLLCNYIRKKPKNFHIQKPPISSFQNFLNALD